MVYGVIPRFVSSHLDEHVALSGVLVVDRVGLQLISPNR